MALARKGTTMELSLDRRHDMVHRAGSGDVAALGSSKVSRARWMACHGMQVAVETILAPPLPGRQALVRVPGTAGATVGASGGNRFEGDSRSLGIVRRRRERSTGARPANAPAEIVAG